MVELLVVLAVVGLLAALIIPSLIKARQQAAASRSLENHPSLGEAFLQYSKDHEGELVPFSQPYAGKSNQEKKSKRLWPELLGSYANKRDSWHCPECRSSGSDGSHGGVAYNRLLASRGINLSEVRKPAGTVVFGDAGPVANPKETNPDLWVEDEASELDETERARFAVPSAPSWQPVKQTPVRMVNRHRGRASAIFADGHAVRLPVSQVGFQYEAGDARALWDNH